MGTPGSRRDRVNINRGAPTRIFNTPGRARQENMEQDGEPASRYVNVLWDALVFPRGNVRSRMKC